MSGLLTRPHPRDGVTWAVLAALVVWCLAIAGQYDVYLATSAVIFALLVLSVGTLAGDTGMYSLCQVSFAAVAAWTATQFAAHGNPLPVVLELVISVLVAGAFGAVVALPALRLRSVNLAVVTLGVAGAVDVFLSARGFGSTKVARPGFANGGDGFLVLCMVCFAAAAVVLGVIRRAPLGTSWRCTRNSERATAAMGVSVVRVKVSAFTISAMMAGLAGVLTLLQLGTLQESSFPPTQSLLVFAVAIFIGGWRWQGALLAGIVGIGLPYLLTRIGVSQDWGTLLFALGAMQALGSGTAVADALWPRRRPSRTAPEDDSDWRALLAGAAAAGAPSDGPAAMQIDALDVRYGTTTAVDAVHLQLRRGEVLGVIGANGAGKTSLIDAVSGYARATGTVTVAGTVVSGSPQRRARAGLRRTFQQDRVPPSVTVGRYLRLAAGRRLAPDELARLVAFAGLSGDDLLIEDLEGSSRRLLEVAAAFASRPHVVLLDEPVAGLSSAEGLRFAQRLREAPAVFGCGALLIEHDVDFVRAVCATAIAMDFGRVIASGTPDDVLADAAVAAAYLGEEVLTR